MFPRGWRGIVRTSCGRVATSPPPVMVHRFLLHGTCSGCVGARVALFPNSGSANGSIMPRLTAISTLLTAPPALTLSSTAGTLSLPPPPPHRQLESAEIRHHLACALVAQTSASRSTRESLATLHTRFFKSPKKKPPGVQAPVGSAWWVARVGLGTARPGDGGGGGRHTTPDASVVPVATHPLVSTLLQRTHHDCS